MPIVVTAVFHPAEGKKDQLVQALQAAIPAVHEEEGCLLYAIHDAADGSITMIEKWTTAELLDAHANGPAVAALEAAVGSFIESPTTVTTMAPIEAGTEVQGLL
ncbi:antibiotic biosynthesis monooxygenase [Arthrobacter sp. SRS-W-1-2016]|uniref:putative quinol monooxygenase n=1 Tax=Arthrobacter sp. SRS-W-1-2016 TaxID=1930254 RepID=UPI00099146C5|nr:putative quinol monooxygenase [Arthrobacter sp. SRS-W-1-2016]OOP59225.1 antibiotic biosynthesis monooxygenase [Arthrobacter sp. SRS-W-1-2016]